MAPDNPVLPPCQPSDRRIQRFPTGGPIVSLSLTPYIGVKDRLGGGAARHGASVPSYGARVARTFEIF